ncbi:MAG: Type pilus assembly protein PilM [Patescibacteria group bacterium]|jgi:hypothetical protein|nr:Type pilus assembly protein PilM [Patescibacteria group bacterium]
MINVLPQNEKIVLHKEYIIRLITVCLFIFSAFSFSISFLLMPAYTVSKNKVSTLEIQLQKYNDLNPENSGNNLSSIITEINQKLDLLDKNLQPKNITEDVIGLALSAKSNGIKFSNLSYFTTLEGKRTLQINGQATDRTSLRAFEDALRNDSRVESTNLPVSNFTKRTNIDFSLAAILK